ncbi:MULTISPECIES: pseudouridine synthase [Brevibacillus]|uniref:Pseudouridine synthase n=1 Tax=Brevibacillus laterosporus TaxID=1465 RepID=A0AAP8QCA7_BRELA|nr:MULTISPECIES: pseudouridine synthase [Brevibacillus]MBG9787347.1 pseudouridine synthase [Brevibacillus laterosporus]MCG7318988.1 rRNA pseudouridine synthase [Brevibacillus laterosporus]MCR8981034.1 rRNA pseudouridine synthase [Brevibacillus laterosporus]MCZ0808189.1 pseudouridine synthase [Brevibacillus laterosporus]MCZ0826381.1 pseudouridine synthase [Brevibacillus laterosporus]
MKRERLDKILANTGKGTRKEVKQLIKQRIVTVDGIVATDPGMHVIPEQQHIEIDGVPLLFKRWVFVMLNKPAGVISATEDALHETVVDLLPDEWRHKVHPVGRLDIDTEGLLLLTNDGQLSHSLLSPKKKVDKEYFARIEGRVTDEHIAAFKQGVTLDDGYETMPATLEILQSGDISEIHVTIMEGKYHQVKRMFAAFDLKVIYLKRVRMGPLLLDESLELGEFRELTEEELNSLRKGQENE